MAVSLMRTLVLWIPVWLSGWSPTSSEVSTQRVFFHVAGEDKVFLPAPSLSGDAQYQWWWTSHDGRHADVAVATITSNTWVILQTKDDVFSSWEDSYLCIEPYFHIAGVYSLIQTEPAEDEPLASFEVFAVQVLPVGLLDIKLARGSDVSMSCALSRLPDGATLYWDREEGPTSNTTLFYNNTSHIVLHNVGQDCSGTYRCTVEMDGTWSFAFFLSPDVRRGKHKKEQSDFVQREQRSSQVNMTCKSIATFRKARWTGTPSVTREPATLTSYDPDRSDPQFQRDRFSSPVFNGTDFPLHVSPVTFEDGGIYRCTINELQFVSVQLITVRVSASPPGEEPVVLSCELSEGSSAPVTLAWMRMEGNRGLLVQEEVLTDSRTLSLTLPSLRTDQLHWQCVVFTEDLLRARVPLTLVMLDSGVEALVIVSCVTVLCAALLSAALVFYCRNRGTQTSTEAVSSPLRSQVDNVYGNITNLRIDKGPGRQRPPADGGGDQDVHYSSFSLGAPQRAEPSGTSASYTDSGVIYSAVNID